MNGLVQFLFVSAYTASFCNLKNATEMFEADEENYRTTKDLSTAASFDREDFQIQSTGNISGIETSPDEDENDISISSVLQQCYDVQTVNGEQIVWSNKLQGENFYSSIPLCINDRNEYVLRECRLGRFTTPAVECAHLQKPPSNCEEGFYEYEDICYKLTEPAPYKETKCPYDFAIPFHEISMIPVDAVWYPARRNYLHGLGQFLVEEYSIDYGSTVNEYVVNDNGIVGYDCLVYLVNEKQLKAVDCGDSYPKICGYEFLHASKNRPCDTYNHMSISFDTSVLQCITNVGSSSLHYYLPFWNGVVYKFDSNNIKIPLLHDPSKGWIWRTGLELQYTNWDVTQLKSDYDKEVILTSMGWSFNTFESSYDLYSYFIKMPRIEGNLRIRYISNNQKIRVVIIGTRSFVKFGDIYAFCSTDADPDKLISTRGEGHEFPVHHSGYYWCEGVALYTYTLMKSQRILVTLHDIYVMELLIKYKANEDPTTGSVAYGRFIGRYAKDYKNKYSEDQLEVDFKWMKTLSLNETTSEVNYLIHICTPDTFDHLKTFKQIEATLDFQIYPEVLNTTKLFNSERCETEDYGGVTWPAVKKYKYTRSVQNCLDANSKPIVRYCGFDFYAGARFSTSATCAYSSEQTSEVTDDLYNLLDSTDSSRVVLKNLTQITESYKSLVPIDIHLISEILLNMDGDVVELQDLTGTISNVMFTSKAILNKAQKELNATDKILDSYDRILNSNKVLHIERIWQNENLLLIVFEAKISQFSGIALLTNNNYMPIYNNMSLEEVANIPNLQIATFIPLELLSQLGKNSWIIITIYQNPSLFNDDTPNVKSIAKHININVPIEIDVEIPILYKPEPYDDFQTEKTCAFWNYGSTKGFWDLQFSPETKGKVQLCRTKHLTHFGLLITNTELLKNPKALEVITAINSVFSLIGVLGIFTTGILFRTWRASLGNKLLMHYSAVYVIGVSLLYLSGKIYSTRNRIGCIIVGYFLHYSVLCQFCWTLMIAYWQYMRYVMVFYESRNRIVNYIVAYLTPTILTLSAIIWYRTCYLESNVQICYPTGNCLIYFLLVPIGIIVIFNLFIFIRIFYELFYKSQSGVDNDVFLLKLRLIIVLYFMLGMTWIAGFCAEILNNIMLYYVFTITSSLQGFIVFLAFIAFNRDVRDMYKNYFKKLYF